MSVDDNLREYRAVFGRVVATKRGFVTSKFTLIIRAADADDAARQGKGHEALLRGTFTLAGVRLIEPGKASRDGRAAGSDSN
jgi:hypothetical protein